jgi:hypothetical protein
MDAVLFADLLDDEIVVNNQSIWKLLSYFRNRSQHIKAMVITQLPLNFKTMQAVFLAAKNMFLN